jgi:hypothetical protein
VIRARMSYWQRQLVPSAIVDELARPSDVGGGQAAKRTRETVKANGADRSAEHFSRASVASHCPTITRRSRSWGRKSLGRDRPQKRAPGRTQIRAIKSAAVALGGCSR